MAGIQALINQRFGEQGNANYVYYALAARQFRVAPAGACSVSQTDGKLPNPACVFHDVNRGDTDIPCAADSNGQVHDCYGSDASDRLVLGELSNSKSHPRPAHRANVGYDLAIGLGSLDATNLFDAWAE